MQLSSIIYYCTVFLLGLMLPPVVNIKHVLFIYDFDDVTYAYNAYTFNLPKVNHKEICLAYMVTLPRPVWGQLETRESEPCINKQKSGQTYLALSTPITGILQKQRIHLFYSQHTGAPHQLMS